MEGVGFEAQIRVLYVTWFQCFRAGFKFKIKYGGWFLIIVRFEEGHDRRLHRGGEFIFRGLLVGGNLFKRRFT